MALELYAPSAKAGRAGIGTFRAVEGCQRVREPVLSPLLYKSYENCPAASGGVPCWCCKGIRANLISAIAVKNILLTNAPWCAYFIILINPLLFSVLWFAG